MNLDGDFTPALKAKYTEDERSHLQDEKDTLYEEMETLDKTFKDMVIERKRVAAFNEALQKDANLVTGLPYKNKRLFKTLKL